MPEAGTRTCESGWVSRHRRHDVNVVRLKETERGDGVAYLRGERDWEHHTLRLIAAYEPRVDHVGWRTHGPGDLDELER